jgi:signal transduction histidine kinase
LKSTEVILRETERLERMVMDIESFCRLPQPVLQPVPASTVLDRVLEDLTDKLKSQGIGIKRNFREPLPRLQADAKLLELALTNIVSNAIEAMPGGGLLELGMDCQADRLLIFIRDSGVGIAAGDLANIFDPFFTSKTRGSGLGLTAAHRIISDHSGEITVSSELGKGTEVRIALPYD